MAAPRPETPRRAFDWALVQSFVAVLDAGSLMGAARATGRTQPTLSRHVAELESQLGVPLFERTGRGVVPTAAALAIAEAARRMGDGAGELLRALLRTTAAEAGTVRVTTSRVAACNLLPPIFQRLLREAPEIEIELVASDAITNLLRREADIAVRMARPEQGSLVARRLGEVAIAACAHRDYLATAGTPRTPAELPQHRLIGYDRDNTITDGFAAMGFPLPRSAFVVRTDDPIAYARMVATGAGIGFLARYHLAQLPGVVPLLPTLPIPPLPCWLAVHREVRGNRAVRRVFDVLAAEIPQVLEAAA